MPCRPFTTLALMLSWSIAGAAEAPQPADGIQRSDLFTFAAGDNIEDSGRLLVTGGRFNREEAFEIVRTAAGERVMTSVTIGADDRYRVQGRWRFAADERALDATGIGAYGEQPVRIEITKADGTATLTVTGAGETVQTAPCAGDCLIDMSPSALPMFTMTRLYDEAAGGAQVFRWVARSLIADQVLLDGSAEIRKLGDYVFRLGNRETPVRQYAFVETLKDEESGQFFKVAFNLYTTADYRPLGFATAGTTVGERAGYEGLTQQLPPRIPPLR